MFEDGLCCLLWPDCGRHVTWSAAGIEVPGLAIYMCKPSHYQYMLMEWSIAAMQSHFMWTQITWTERIWFEAWGDCWIKGIRLEIEHSHAKRETLMVWIQYNILLVLNILVDHRAARTHQYTYQQEGIPSVAHSQPYIFYQYYHLTEAD